MMDEEIIIRKFLLRNFRNEKEEEEIFYNFLFLLSIKGNSC